MINGVVGAGVGCWQSSFTSSHVIPIPVGSVGQTITLVKSISILQAVVYSVLHFIYFLPLLSCGLCPFVPASPGILHLYLDPASRFLHLPVFRLLITRRSGDPKLHRSSSSPASQLGSSPHRTPPPGTLAGATGYGDLQGPSPCWCTLGSFMSHFVNRKMDP